MRELVAGTVKFVVVVEMKERVAQVNCAYIT